LCGDGRIGSDSRCMKIFKTVEGKEVKVDSSIYSRLTGKWYVLDDGNVVMFHLDDVGEMHEVPLYQTVKTIPANRRVEFLDGDPLNCTASNIILVARK